MPGFRTLTVKGRHDFSRDINAPEMPNDGNLYLDSRIEYRSLKIEFHLRAASVAEFNSAVAKLQQILYQPQVQVRFADQPGYYFIGTASLSFDEPTINTKGTITITCSDPYRYSDAQTISGNGLMDVVIGNSQLTYPVKPKKFQCIAANSGSSVELYNQSAGKKFIAHIAYSAGDTIVINFADLDFQINHVSHLMDIDLSSNMEDFFIQNGNRLTCNVNGSYSLEYEVKQL